MASTEEGRKFLKYLVMCALPEGESLYADAGGRRHEFHGVLGFAPDWADGAMTLTAQRWVSACLLAHVNALGKHVRLSLRADPPPVPGLASTVEEEREYSIHEGDFFGNLFAEKPVSYACRGARTAAQEADPVLQARRCTSGACGFVITGACATAGSHTAGGVTYGEFIRVYLKPGTSSIEDE